jgi:50S ribosomal subunit-associated GTPase HflX
MNEELDVLLDNLKNDTTISTLMEQNTAVIKEPVTDDNINSYVMKKISKLIDDGMVTIESIQQDIISSSTYESEQLEAFSNLFKSVVKAADTLNKINLQNKKDKSLKELKQMDIQMKKEFPDSGGNTNILIATREEIIKTFLKDVNDTDKSTIDVTDYKEEQTNEN